MTARRIAFVIVALLVFGAVAWLAFGRITQTAEERITAQLVAHGLPQPIASCMGRELTERLSLPQLARLERLRSEEGEDDGPLTVAGFVERLRRVDDPRVIEAGATVAAVCALRHGLS